MGKKDNLGKIVGGPTDIPQDGEADVSAEAETELPLSDPKDLPPLEEAETELPDPEAVSRDLAALEGVPGAYGSGDKDPDVPDGPTDASDDAGPTPEDLAQLGEFADDDDRIFDVPEPDFGVAVGDTVAVVTDDNAIREFPVTAINDDGTIDAGPREGLAYYSGPQVRPGTWREA
ncbi:MAG: hypothetical protein ACRDUY_08160 [Nitriliruptorales bacterium]